MLYGLYTVWPAGNKKNGQEDADKKRKLPRKKELFILHRKVYLIYRCDHRHPSGQ